MDSGFVSNKTKLFTQSFTVIQAFQADFCVINFVQLLMGLNLSNSQIAKELGLDKDDLQKMTTQLRQGIVDGKGEVQLSGEVECDGVYV